MPGVVSGHWWGTLCVTGCYLASSHRHWLPVSDPHTQICEISAPVHRSGPLVPCTGRGDCDQSWPGEKQKLPESRALILK